MKITFLGKAPESRENDCPTLYDTDRSSFLVTLTDRATHLVCGLAGTDPEARAALDLPVREDVVEVPLSLRAVVRKEYAGAGEL